MTAIFLLAAGLTLTDLESRLLTQNPEYLQAEQSIKIAEGRQIQAGLYPNPSIGSTGEHVSRSTRGGSIGGFLEQRIVMGGKLGLARQMASREMDQAVAMRDAWRLRLRGELQANFYSVLAAAERVKARDRLAASASATARIARELQNIGRLDAPDVKLADVESHRAALRLAQARQQEDRAWTELAALLNTDTLTPHELDGLIDDLPQLDRAGLWSRVIAQSPEVAIAVTGRAKAELAIRAARAARVPDLQLRGGLRNNREIGDVPGGRPVGVEGIFDVGIEIPLFNRQQGNLRAARAGLARAETEGERTRRDLQARFAAAWQQYSSAQSAVIRYREEMLPAAREALETYEKNFRGMQGEYAKVLLAQRTYFALLEEYIDGLEAGWHAAAELESLLLARSARREMVPPGDGGPL